MDWNKEVIKGPMPVWVIVLAAILSGCFISFLVNSRINTDHHKVLRTVTCFVLGASGYLYLWLLARLAKNPTPWLQRNMRLLMAIGGLINAILIFWAIASKK